MGVKMTKADLETMVKDIVGASLSELKERNRDYMKDFFEAQKDAEADYQRRRKVGVGEMAGRWVRALAAGRGDPERAARYVRQNWKDDNFAKSLSESVMSEGGALVPDEYVAELIELLRARSVVRALGAVQLPMDSGSLTMPRQTGAASAGYVGENKPIPTSQPSFGQLQLSAKKLAALVPISNDLLRDSSPRVDAVVRDDLVAVMALREDLAFLRDDGTDNKPKGLRHWANANNVFPVITSGDSALENTTATLAKAIRLIEEANVPMNRMGWVFTPRTKWFLMQQRDGNGNYAWRDDLVAGSLFGYPYQTTTQLPNNLGEGDESEIYLADFSQAIIGENTNLLVDVSTEATYHDDEGNPISVFENDMTLMRTIARHDFGVRHDEAVSVVTGVDWADVGAGGGNGGVIG